MVRIEVSKEQLEAGIGKIYPIGFPGKLTGTVIEAERLIGVRYPKKLLQQLKIKSKTGEILVPEWLLKEIKDET